MQLFILWHKYQNIQATCSTSLKIRIAKHRYCQKIISIPPLPSNQNKTNVDFCKTFEIKLELKYLDRKSDKWFNVHSCMKRSGSRKLY